MATSLLKLLSIFFILTSLCTPHALSDDDSSECESEEHVCTDKSGPLPLKLIASFSILASSVIGVSAPFFSRSIPALQPNRSLFLIVKGFASGIVLGTGFMHVLPDSFDHLSSGCPNENPWYKFPFTSFVAMLSALVTLMVDSMPTSICMKNANDGVIVEGEAARGDQEKVDGVSFGHFNGHHHHDQSKPRNEGSQLAGYRVITMVLELGIIVHSVVIGLSLGASNNICTIKGLVSALCFHQTFEGMGLGGSILESAKCLKRIVTVFFFSVTPFGIALEIALSKTHKENSPTALITVGLLNASPAGLLIYMALVDLQSADFMGPKLQGSIKLQIKCHIAVFLGAGGMPLMAKWA